MQEYYLLLRSVLKGKAQLRRCLTRCRHCRIFFLTDPRNVGQPDAPEKKRWDLGCPFGCREAHRKKQSTLRSVAFYQTSEGRQKRLRLNQRRRKPKSVEGKPAQETPPKSPEEGKTHLRWPGDLIEYLVLVIGWIEGRKLGVDEVLELLERQVKQHTIGRRRLIDRMLEYLNQRPP